MKKIFIDKFFIPESSFKEFSERMNFNRKFIKNLPGFIHDKVYKSKDETGNILIITVAEWERDSALNKAKESVRAEYKRTGFNPQEMMQRLYITMERGIYKNINANSKMK